MNYARSNNLGLKYLMFTLSGSKDLWIRKFEFVTKTYFLLKKNDILEYFFSILLKSAKIHCTISYAFFKTLSKLLILILFRWRKDAFLWRLYYALPYSALENPFCSYSSYRYIHSFHSSSFHPFNNSFILVQWIIH